MKRSMKKKKDFLKIKTTIVFLLFVFSISIPFIAGSLSSSSKKEEIATYISNVVDTKTVGQMSLGITAEKEKSSSLPNSEDQFHQLYGLFNEQEASFASGYNIHRDSEVIVEDISENTNYSFFYFSSSETKFDEKKKRLRHVVYPVQFMFELKRYNEVSKYVICISKSDADVLLTKKGVEKKDESFSEEDYKSLIAQPITVSIDNQNQTFVIQDIYYEDGYYYQYLREVFGNLFMTSYYMEDFLIKENVYFMSKHSFKNSFFLDYMNKIYDEETVFRCSNNNLTSSIDDKRIISYFKEGELQHTGELIALVALIIIDIFLAVVFIFLSYKYFKRLKFILILFLFTFITYELFKVVSLIACSTIFFSDFSIKYFLIVVFVELFSLIALRLISKKKKHEVRYLNEGFYELDI